MAVLHLASSVGDGGVNDPYDVKTVVDRFVELGYVWVGDCVKGKEKKFIELIHVFQSMCKGSGKADKGTGKISVGGETHRWLAAENAPGWVKVFGGTGLGWQSTMDYSENNGGYATSWLLERLRWTGMMYRAAAMVSVSDAPPLWVRECSPKTAGNASGHKSHETGLDVDIRLPLLPPKSDQWFQLRENTYSKYFHYDAAILQCEMIKTHMQSKYIFFNDPRFIKKHLTSKEANHSEHYHVRIKPPARIEGVYS